MNKNPLLESKEVHKLYQGPKNNPVLQGVNLRVDQGKLIGILGVSGAGKSTLLNILGLLDQPTEGSLFLMGKDCTKIPPNQAAEIRNKYLGFVFQFFYFITFGTIDNIK